MSAVQKSIGIISDCNSVKVGVAGTFLTFRNDEIISSFGLSYPNRGHIGSGDLYLDPYNVTVKSGLYKYSNSNNMTSQFRINGSIVLDTIYSSYLPICGYTNQCNHPPVFNASTVKYSNNITAYRYNVDGQYYKIRQSLVSDLVLGSWYQFTATPNDFIVVEDELSLNQYHLSVVHSGFYDFNEYPPCLNQLPNIRNLALEQVQVTSSSVAKVATVYSSVPLESTIPITSTEIEMKSTQTTFTQMESFTTSLFSDTTAATIPKRTRVKASTSIYDTNALTSTLVTTNELLPSSTTIASQGYANGKFIVFLPFTLRIFIKEFISLNLMLIVALILCKKIKVWIQKYRKRKKHEEVN